MGQPQDEPDPDLKLGWKVEKIRYEWNSYWCIRMVLGGGHISTEKWKAPNPQKKPPQKSVSHFSELMCQPLGAVGMHHY